MGKYGKLIVYNKFTEYLIAQIKRKGLGDSELREAVNVEKRLWRRKKQNPQDFTLKQILQISETLEVDKDLLIRFAYNENTED